MKVITFHKYIIGTKIVLRRHNFLFRNDSILKVLEIPFKNFPLHVFSVLLNNKHFYRRAGMVTLCC